MTCNHEGIKLEIGNGRKRKTGFITIDMVQFIDGNGDECVDIVRDIEKFGLPFCDNSVDLIVAENVLEHMYETITVMNELHRVLKFDGKLIANVPDAGSVPCFQDPTHRSFWSRQTLDYFTGKSAVLKNRPSHPRYADYGVLPWDKLKVDLEKDDIRFELSPRKDEE